MNEEIRTLSAADTHNLDCFFATPSHKPKGGVMILQEIFGVTEQLKELAREYAELG